MKQEGVNINLTIFKIAARLIISVILIIGIIWAINQGCDSKPQPKPTIPNNKKEIAVNSLDLQVTLANNKDMRRELDSIKSYLQFTESSISTFTTLFIKMLQILAIII